MLPMLSPALSLPLVGKAYIAGMVYSAPLGPSAALALRSILTGRTVAGLMVVLGAFSAEVLATLLTVSGFRLVTGSLTPLYMYMGGGVLTLIIGLFIFFSSPPEIDKKCHKTEGKAAVGYWLSGLTITFLNPMSFIGLVLLFSSLGIRFEGTRIENSFLVLILFLGCCTWWITLLSTLFYLKSRVSRTFLRRLNQSIGSVLILLAAYAFWSGTSYL